MTRTCNRSQSTLSNSAALTLRLRQLSHPAVWPTTVDAHDVVLLLRSPLVQQASVHTLVERGYEAYTNWKASHSIFFAKSAEISVVGLQVRFPVHMEM